MNGITLDGVYYNVAVTFGSMKRSFNLKEGSAKGESIMGRKIRDILGTEYTYEMNVEPFPDDILSYDLFYQEISQPVDSHTITLPYNQTTITFDAAIESGSDNYTGNYNNKEHWNGLTIKFSPMEPQRFT